MEFQAGHPVHRIGILFPPIRYLNVEKWKCEIVWLEPERIERPRRSTNT
jgi:hypothetical protein